MSNGIHIDRCYCFQMTFEELRGVAARTGASSVEELQAHREFGLRCRLCHPYIRRMLRTGRVVFHEIITADDEESRPA